VWSNIKLFPGIQDLFEVYQPIAMYAYNLYRGGILLVGIGVRVRGGGIVDVPDIDGQDLGVPVLSPLVLVHSVIVLFPLVEEHLVGGVAVHIEVGFVIIAVQGGPDKFAAGVLGIFGFFIGMGAGTGYQEYEGWKQDLFNHGIKIKKSL